ncbi:hypothetical protein [Geomonas agri]|uniref:hypothetical protein n=1 Tax=Geomonas agri TaxID=2873702 RepID=UPI001CD3D33F|nr:hypothetical protein [Geomonas agri]
MKEITCPACNYTRQPTDDAPEWACPKCLKAYAKTGTMAEIVPKDSNCKIHPSHQSSWQCSDCGSRFCHNCVTPLKHTTSYLYEKVPIGLCPECKGLCANFEYVEKFAAGELPHQKATRKRARTVLISAIAPIPAMIAFFVFAPPELRLVGAIGAYAICSVLSWQWRLDQWIGGGSIFGLDNKEYHLIHDKPRPLLTLLLFIIAAASVFCFLYRVLLSKTLHWI